MILFDLGSAWKKLAQWRKELYELCNIGWHDAETESHNALVFGNLVCWFISEVKEERRRGRGEERGRGRGGGRGRGEERGGEGRGRGRGEERGGEEEGKGGGEGRGGGGEGRESSSVLKYIL